MQRSLQNVSVPILESSRLRFAVFDNEVPANDWPTGRAYLFGPQGVPMQADIAFDAGCIVCAKSTDDAAGLSLQFDMDHDAEPDLPGPLGSISLSTCLLPERDEPYLLTLELARQRIMAFLNKLEDWGLFDAGDSSPEMIGIMEQFEMARAAFTKALVAQRAAAGVDGGLSAEADKLSRRALAIALDAGENLTLAAARRDLPRRVSGSFYKDAAEHYETVHNQAPPPDAPVIYPGVTGVVLPTKPLLGCAVDPIHFDDSLKETISETCDFISLPFRWVDMEPVEGRYAFKNTDRWIEWAVRKAKIPIVAGPVIDFRPHQAPTWLFVWENDYETLRELVYEHVRQIVTRYRRTIRRWTVATGLHVNTNFQLGFEQVMDLTRVAVLILRKLHPQAKVQLEITQPWGEYYAENRRSLPPKVYAEMVAQVGISVDAYGLRLQLGQPKPGQTSRDLMALSSLLDSYAQLERPIAITALGAPSANLKPEEDELPAGHWRDGWSPQAQADWLSKAAAVCLSKPFVHSVCWQDLAESSEPGLCAEMPSGALFDSAGRPRPAFERFKAVGEAIKRDGECQIDSILGG